ncbi:proteasome activator pa28 REG alpha/beta subunit [Pleurotus eryngii]|uniref:Proteasome activator pa28 REG alpha/beta subunit n=1 Tax=Pleurotus eryngii TaxID=5323 RepID=A0A9P6A9I4_PLEER|nr:proteasome activator pa28 REG alpha/beta subunit [Pleurotus eryngii]
MATDKEAARKLEEFRRSVTNKGEDIVFKVFPNKIIELHQIIQTYSNADSPFNMSHSRKTDTTIYPPPSNPDAEDPHNKKRRRTADGSAENGDVHHISHPKHPDLVHSNQHITSLHETVKKECDQLADLCDQVKLWVNLTMPKIEDGDNFGVQVQEEVLAELMRAQDSAYNVRDAARQDHLQRAKICSKLVKYPHIEDYAASLREHDEKQLYFIRQHLIDIRNIYAVLTDLIHKNIYKIRVPKGNNGMGLY